MMPKQKSIFIGGPLDGEIRIFSVRNSWTILEPESRRNLSRWRRRKYVKVHESSDGATAIFELEPNSEKFFYVVEVDAVEGASENKVEQILNDLLKHIDGHHEAFYAGVTAARVSPEN